MTIYLVTDGDYSDYHILGAFSSKEMAEKVIKTTGGSIEELKLDEIGKDNRFKYFVRINNNDSTHVFWTYTEHNINEVKEVYNKAGYYVTVMAEDKEHAIKIASDLVAQYKAINNK